jgi:hypothetical protein
MIVSAYKVRAVHEAASAEKVSKSVFADRDRPGIGVEGVNVEAGRQEKRGVAPGTTAAIHGDPAIAGPSANARECKCQMRIGFLSPRSGVVSGPGFRSLVTHFDKRRLSTSGIANALALQECTAIFVKKT